jgi:predicted phosphodiesterase
MTILYLGDCHGIANSISHLDQKANARGINYIIQVGDFGTFFPSRNQRKKFAHDGVIRQWRSDGLDFWIEKRAKRGKWHTKILTCGGNHDNWTVFDRLEEEQGYPDMVELYPGSGVYYIPRNTIINLDGITHLFLGGALSIDKYRRTEGLDLWEYREEPNREEFELFFRRLESYKPDTIVTHEAPLRVPVEKRYRKASTSPRMFEHAIKMSKYKPKRWYFGHHHVLDKWKIKGTKFYCCGLHGQCWERN